MTLLVDPGLSLKNLDPRVWDKSSRYYLPKLQAVMVSFADFHSTPARRQKAMELGLHKYLGVPKRIQIYLDNGAFYFMKLSGGISKSDYEET